jgi:hypothetical protein
MDLGDDLPLASLSRQERNSQKVPIKPAKQPKNGRTKK